MDAVLFGALFVWLMFGATGSCVKSVVGGIDEGTGNGIKGGAGGRSG